MKKKCEMCSEPFESKRKDARFCSGKCRIASVRGKPKTSAAVAKPTRAETRYKKALAAALGVPVDQVVTVKCENRLSRKVADVRDPNSAAREALKKRIPVAKPAPPVHNPAPASVFSLLKSTLAKKDERGPVQAKKKAQPKGGADS